jgi:hypothetical protein
MQQYTNLEKLRKNHQKLATKLTNHFTKHTSWQSDPITIFESGGDWLRYEMRDGYLSNIIKELESKYPEIYESIDYSKLILGIMDHFDPNYYYYDDETGSIIMITPEE